MLLMMREPEKLLWKAIHRALLLAAGAVKTYLESANQKVSEISLEDEG